MNTTEIKWETVLCIERNTTKQAAVAKLACSRLVIKLPGTEMLNRKMLKDVEKEERRCSQPEQREALKTFCQQVEKKD